MFNCREHFFSEYSVFLIMKVAAAINSSMYTVFFRRAYAAMNCVYKGALAAVHLSVTITISGNYLKWPSVFRGTVFLWNKSFQPFLFSKVILQFQLQSSIGLMSLFLSYKSSCSHAFFQIYCVFSENDSGMFIIYCYFYDTVINSWERLKRFIMSRALCLFYNTYSRNSLSWAVCSWFEKTWCLFEESHFSPGLLKVLIYSIELVSYSNFCSKSAVLNVRMHLQSSRSFLVKMLIWQFHNSNCSYVLNKVNFLEKQLLIFPLARVDFQNSYFLSEFLGTTTVKIIYLKHFEAPF